MANGFNLPPILQEFDHFISLCKKMNVDLTKASARLSELETDLAKEKAERKNLQNISHRKIQDLTTQSENLRTELDKTIKAHRDETTHLRNMLMSAQNENKTVVKIVQEELERTQFALRNEIQAKTDLINELQKIKSEYETILTLQKKEQDSTKTLSLQLKSAKDELENTKTFLKRAQEDYARIVQNSGKAEDALHARENELRKQLQTITLQAKSEQESRVWLNNMLIKLQKDYDKVLQQLQQEKQNETAEKAVRTRDEEILRLQEQLIKAKRNQQDLEEARKSAQSLANQLRSELETTRTDLERLRTAHPLKALLMNKEFKIQEITEQLSKLPENHPLRQDLTTSLDTNLMQKNYFEQLLKESGSTH